MMTCLALLPSAALARKPRLRLAQVDHSQCAAKGQITALAAVVELEGTLGRPEVSGMRLLLDGKPLPDAPLNVQRFAATKQALRVALVVQTSSDYAMDFGRIKAGVAALIKALPERAQVLLIVFHWEARRLFNLGSKRGALDALEQLKVQRTPGDLALVSALKMGLRGLRADKQPARRLLVVLSDGLNRSPKRRLFRQLGDRARKAGVPIYPVGFTPIDERGPLLNLGEIAKRSGGTFRWARRPEDVAGELTNLAAEINQQLVLTFKVPDRCAAAHLIKLSAGQLLSDERSTPAVKQQAAKVVRQRKSRRGWWPLAAAGAGALGLALVALLVVLLRRKSRGGPPAQPVAPAIPASPKPAPEPPPPAAAPQPTLGVTGPMPAALALIGQSPGAEGVRLVLRQGQTLIGTAPDCQVRLDPAQGVETYHARLTLRGVQLVIEDLESRAGVLVNGQPARRAELRPGDMLQVGQVVFQLA